MSQFNSVQNPREDAVAVAAIQRGDPERYAELVERNERRVFAIAWSRLGNTALAEEATQEAFIRGYRSLWMLGNGGKFASWIAAIARNTAINLGIRDRRELRKRERWSVEVPQAAPHPEDPSDPEQGETIRRALEGLPASHRECLVLFYIEGKSGSEAAIALGISEAAFRVRLHRARAALREQLEHTLAGSLEQLRPSKKMASTVMGAILASSTAKAATVGAGSGLSGALAKVIPLAWVLPYLSWIAILPMPFMGWFYARYESRNFRDPKGLRARFLREGIALQMLWLIPMMASIWWLTPLLSALYGFHAVFFGVGIFSLIMTIAMGRRLKINQNRFFVLSVVSSGVLTIGCFAVAFRVLPISAFNAVIGAHMILTLWSFGERPNRMDYNLFFRDVEGMLRHSQERETRVATRFEKKELLPFARFLGSRWLVTNFRWVKNGLELDLPSIRGWGMFGLLYTSRRASRITLSSEGTVLTVLSERDQQVLKRVCPKRIKDRMELESDVRQAVESSWTYFLGKEFSLAENAIGHLPEKELFLVSPRKSPVTRWYRWISAALIALMLLLQGFLWFKFPWMEGLKPVELSEVEVRNALATFGTPNAPANTLSNGLYYFLSYGVSLPKTNLFTPPSLEAVREQILRSSGFVTDAKLEQKNSTVTHSWPLERALAGNWLRLEDLQLARESVVEFLRDKNTGHWEFQFARRQCPTDAGNLTIESIDISILAQLQWLRDLRCLDVLNREKLIDHIASLQVLSGKESGGRPPLPNWRDLRGLFIIPGWPVLQDTYSHLAALEILGGLDRIDREACSKAILKLHHGAGYFSPPETDEKWRLNIRGDARNTFCAMESLRILGSLDRVKDLPQWKFRVRRDSGQKDEPAQVTWEQIEAWLGKQQLERYLLEAKNGK